MMRRYHLVAKMNRIRRIPRPQPLPVHQQILLQQPQQ
ncbi:hypothetical protein PAHAL_8G184800 [Panicum hallii]|uniref:Uncharacterized protein n=1 Tax=Panicum hallii TaxID=206008 RepID=A0A2T8I9C8_9POAL|nr:hypothetical protein PAHAL_8G184800 [Panicum hallii]